MIGCQERCRIKQDTLSDTSRSAIVLGAGLLCKLHQATSGISGRRLLRSDEKRADVRTQNWSLCCIDLQRLTHRVRWIQQDAACCFC